MFDNVDRVQLYKKGLKSTKESQSFEKTPYQLPLQWMRVSP